MIKVKLSGVKMISNYTLEQGEQIKEELTYNNPAYINARRHGGFVGNRIPDKLIYYKEQRNRMIVPRGYVIPFPFEIVEDNRKINTDVKFPKLRIDLRGTQKEARDSFIDKVLNDREENGVIVLPTGKGKSILGLYLAGKLSQRVLVVVQKDDLVNGWRADAKVTYGIQPGKIGLIKAGKFVIGEHITITTIQTLSSLPYDKIRELHDLFGMVIVDEFHRSVAKIYDAIHYFPARFKIGLTATPMRNDGLGDLLFHYFGKKAYEFIDSEFDTDILPVNVKLRHVPMTYYPKTEKKYNHAKKLYLPVPINIHQVRFETYNNLGFKSMLTRDIVKEASKGKSCIVFTHTKDHCNVIYEELIEYLEPGIVQQYTGDLNNKDKVEFLRRAEEKEVLITIATYAIATEGTNVKSWERAFMASSIANEKDTIQAIGRIRRTKKDKTDCLVYDYRFDNVVSMDKHGNTRDRVYKKNGYNVVNPVVTELNKRERRRGFSSISKYRRK